ncbi:hypothetical protein QBC36DRAFT_149186, partial [Triangularia setosa]
WAKLMALTEALNLSILRLCLATGHDGVEVNAFTNSYTTLEYLHTEPFASPGFKPTMHPMYAYLCKLSKGLKEMGAALTLSWIPGHKHGVLRHKLADTTSRATLSKKLKEL